jgi:hypothetical protein
MDSKNINTNVLIYHSTIDITVKIKNRKLIVEMKIYLTSISMHNYPGQI